MRRLDGPHAFVYYSRSEGKVYFARDCLGRRSLLKRTRASEGDLVLTSTAPPPQTDVDVQGDAWAEVGCEGIWELDLATMVAQGQESALKLHERFYDSQAPPAGSLVRDPSSAPAHSSQTYPLIERSAVVSSILSVSSTVLSRRSALSCQ